VARDSEDIEALRVAIEVAREVGLEERDLLRARALLAKLEEQDRPMALTDLSRDDMGRLQASESREEAISELMGCMGLSLHDGFQAEVLAEFHYHNFLFTQSQGFNAEQASTFLSVMKHLHLTAIERQRMTQQEARDIFEDLIRRHSQQLPPFSIAAFSDEQALAIKAYADRGFFRHFRMYAHMYERQPVLSVACTEALVGPSVPDVAPLHRCFEVDPQEVVELQDLFIDASVDDGVAEAGPSAPIDRAASRTMSKSALAPRRVSSLGSGLPVTNGHASAGDSCSALQVDSATKAEVEAAIDDILKELLPPLDARLQEVPG